jgi:hypothetical protein
VVREGRGHGLEPTVTVELVQDMADVIPHRRGAHAQRLRDLKRGSPRDEQTKYLTFARSQEPARQGRSARRISHVVCRVARGAKLHEELSNAHFNQLTPADVAKKVDQYDSVPP